MITTLEAIYIFLYIAVKNVVPGKPESFQLIQAILWYCVISPYVFIMNTSHNKKRIIECGWKNVLKNTLGCSNNYIGDSNVDSNNKRHVHQEYTNNQILAHAQGETPQYNGFCLLNILCHVCCLGN